MPQKNYRSEVLAAMPGTCKEIFLKTKFAKSTIHNLVKALHGGGDCYIKEWIIAKGTCVALYAKGFEDDAKFPEVQKRRVKLKIKKTGKMCANDLLVQRALTLRDPIIDAMFPHRFKNITNEVFA